MQGKVDRLEGTQEALRTTSWEETAQTEVGCVGDISEGGEDNERSFWESQIGRGGIGSLPGYSLFLLSFLALIHKSHLQEY